jgi:hypothetical protein
MAAESTTYWYSLFTPEVPPDASSHPLVVAESVWQSGSRLFTKAGFEVSAFSPLGQSQDPVPAGGDELV